MLIILQRLYGYFAVSTDLCRKNNMERAVYQALREKVCAVYEKIISELNSDKGKIKLGNQTVLKINGAISKKDIYAAVANEVGMGCTERTAGKYIKLYLKQKSTKKTNP